MVFIAADADHFRTEFGKLGQVCVERLCFFRAAWCVVFGVEEHLVEDQWRGGGPGRAGPGRETKNIVNMKMIPTEEVSGMLTR